jgi:hypothetical protein
VCWFENVFRREESGEKGELRIGGDEEGGKGWGFFGRMAGYRRGAG